VSEPEPWVDSDLLWRALRALEYVTWHDGRYDQHTRQDWQRDAQRLVTDIAARFGVKPYEDWKEKP
jgi:hypothetical protein